MVENTLFNDIVLNREEMVMVLPLHRVKAMRCWLLQCYYFQHYFNWSFREFFIYLLLREFEIFFCRPKRLPLGVG